MKNISHHVGTLEIIQRMPLSVNGNPRYMARIDGITCYTAPDSSDGYRLPNFDGLRVEAYIGTYYGRPTIHSIRKE